MNRVRNVSGLDPHNRYPAHYTWNFYNDGERYTGVNFIHSFDFIMNQGHMTTQDYGPDTAQLFTGFVELGEGDFVIGFFFEELIAADGGWHNPVPVKAALAMMGQIEEEYRLPLVPMSAKNKEALKATMKACGLLS